MSHWLRSRSVERSFIVGPAAAGTRSVAGGRLELAADDDH
jgi:hypothetical protein